MDREIPTYNAFETRTNKVWLKKLLGKFLLVSFVDSIQVETRMVVGGRNLQIVETFLSGNFP